MKRTIEIRQDNAYYRGEKIEYILYDIRKHFGLKNSRVYKYVITIVPGTQYRLKTNYDGYYEIRICDGKTEEYLSIVCISHFRKLFFTPNQNKKYNITVKKVRIRRS